MQFPPYNIYDPRFPTDERNRYVNTNNDSFNSFFSSYMRYLEGNDINRDYINQVNSKSSMFRDDSNYIKNNSINSYINIPTDNTYFNYGN